MGRPVSVLTGSVLTTEGMKYRWTNGIIMNAETGTATVNGKEVAGPDS
jgi:hypothetical protein